MATLKAYELLDAGVHLTQAAEPVLCNVTRTVEVHAIMPDATILDDTPLRITTLAIEQSIDDGLTWTSMSKVSWESDPETEPHIPGDPLPRPGLSTSVPVDGKTRRFRARLDIPQPLLIGIDVTVS